MADRIDYLVPPAPPPTARDAWEAFIETLHTSGTLRVLTGLCGRFADVADVALTEANSPAGRHFIGSIALLGECLARLPARKLSSLADGLETGVDRAAQTLHGDPPSTFHLLRLARDPDARRAIAAGLEILSAIGSQLSHEPSGNGRGSGHGRKADAPEAGKRTTG